MTRGVEFAEANNGSEFLQSNPYPAEIAAYLRGEAPPPDSAAAADWMSWQPTPGEHAAGRANVVRVGRARGLDSGPDPLVCMGGLGQCHTSLRSGETSEELARQLALRMVGSARNVNVWILDLARTRAFVNFAASGVCTNVYPEEVDNVLADLVRQQHRITEHDVVIGSARDPWNLLLMTGDPKSGAAKDNLALLTQDTKWGSIVAVGSSIPDSNRLQCDFPPIPGFYPDAQVPGHMITSALKSVAESSRTVVPSMRELVLAQGERMPSAQGLEARVGVDGDGEIVTVSFGEDPVHGLIVGKTGSGKTNMTSLMIADLLHSYGPEDMQLFVIDGKKADMSILVPDKNVESDKAYFPQLALAGLNVIDPEDSIAILEYLQEEMERRALRIGDVVAKNIEGLRQKCPEEPWPQILVIWDEVQILLNGPEGMKAMNILVRLATEGRGSGIRMLLGTQDWRNVDSLWTAPAILEQFGLRVALRGGDRVMDQDSNSRIMSKVPKYGAAINALGGVRYTDSDNQIATAPKVTTEDMAELRSWAARKWRGHPPTTVLDGRVSPKLENSQYYKHMAPKSEGAVAGIVGQAPGYQDRAVTFEFRRSPGRNFVVLGDIKMQAEANDLIHSVTKSVAKQNKNSEVTFSVLCLGPNTPAAENLVSELHKIGHNAHVYKGAEANEFLSVTADSIQELQDNQHFLVIYGGEAANQKCIKQLAENGSQQGTHIIGWWPSLGYLRESLGGFISSVSGMVDGLAVLNIDRDELSSLTDQQTHPTWGHFMRNGRALFFDARGNTGSFGQVVKTYK